MKLKYGSEMKSVCTLLLFTLETEFIPKISMNFDLPIVDEFIFDS